MFGNSVGSGVGTVAVLSLGFIVLTLTLGANLPGGAGLVCVWSFWVIGLTQVLYVVPLYLRWRAVKPAAGKGLIIGASIVALLNASCWGAFEAIFRR